MNKTVLLASFIFPERLEWFYSYVKSRFNIDKDGVFVYANLDDESKIIVTFKFVLPETKKINLKDLFPNAVLIHKKGNAIYTINALNKLIETISDGNNGNIDYKSVSIDWSEYQGKMILMNHQELNIINIKRIF